MTSPEPRRYCLDDMLTVQQLCERLPQTTPGMVYRWAGCPRYRTGKRNLYMWVEVLAYLRDRSHTSPAVAGTAARRGSEPIGEVFSMPHRTGRPADSLSGADRGTLATPRSPARADRRDHHHSRRAETTPPPDAA